MNLVFLKYIHGLINPGRHSIFSSLLIRFVTMDGQFTLVHSGDEYFSTLESLLDGAQQSIRIFVYTLQDDTTGRQVIASLKKAVDRKVAVHLLVDSFGSKDLSDEAIEDIYNVGISFRTFSSYLTGNIYSLGRRLHMKMVLVDDHKILIGGINFSDNYSNIGRTAWQDYAVYFESDKTGRELSDLHELVFNKKLSKRVYESFRFRGPHYKVLVNDWVYQELSIPKAYNELVENCQEELVIMVSYFLPGARFLRKLAKASARGVKVKLINSRNWDIPFMKYAVRYLYPWMMRNGIQLYEWMPTVLHAKVVVADNMICSLGSYNLNGLSKYNSLEMNVVIAEPVFVSRLNAEIAELVKDETRVARIDRYHPNPVQKVVSWLSYRIVRASLYIMFFLINEGRSKRNSGTK